MPFCAAILLSDASVTDQVLLLEKDGQTHPYTHNKVINPAIIPDTEPITILFKLNLEL